MSFFNRSDRFDIDAMSFDHLVLSLFIVSVSFYWQREGLRVLLPAPAFYLFIVAISLTKACVLAQAGSQWWIDHKPLVHFDDHLLDRIQSWNHELKVAKSLFKARFIMVSLTMLCCSSNCLPELSWFRYPPGWRDVASPFRYSVLPLANLHNGSLEYSYHLHPSLTKNRMG